MVCFCGRREPGLGPAADSLFFASPKKSKQKKGDPAVCDPCGANLRRGVCGVRRGTRYALARCARTTTASQITKHAREGAHATPQTPRRRRSQKGVGSPTAQQPNSPTAQQPHGPLLRSAPMGAGALRRAAPGRAQRWPEGMFGCGIPSGCAEERSGQRIRARDCLSAAGASSSETPLDASTAGCPQRSEGTQRVGSPFFWVRFFGEAKKSTSPAGARPGLRPHPAHTQSYKNNSC